MATKKKTYTYKDLIRSHVEDAVRLYNVDESNEIAVREMRIELGDDKGDYHYSLESEIEDIDDYYKHIGIAEDMFIHWLESFRALMDKAIKGDKPTDEDLSTLNLYLIKERCELSSPEKFRDPTTGRYAIIEWPEDPYYSYYNGILQIWNGEVEVRRCKNCAKIFIPNRKDKLFHSKKCLWQHNNQKKKDERAAISKPIVKEEIIKEMPSDTATEKECYDYLKQLLHPKGLHCPQGHPLPTDQSTHNSDYPTENYRCRKCGKVFNILTGTDLPTRYKYKKIVAIIKGIANGESITSIAKSLGINRSHLSNKKKAIQDLLNPTTPINSETENQHN